MNENSNDTNEPDRGYRPSRRTMLAAAAWSVPVVVVANAAPALAAATPSNPIRIDFTGSTACKIPGNSWSQDGICYNKGYVLWAKFVNTGNVDVTLTSINSMVLGSNSVQQCIVNVTRIQGACTTNYLSYTPFPGQSEISGGTVFLPAGGVAYIAIFSNANSDSASTSILVNFSYNDGSGSQSADTAGSLNGESWTNPIGGNADPEDPNGVGSCSFPPGNTCLSPPTAVGTYCSSCAPVA